MDSRLSTLIAGAKAFEREAHAILAAHEASASRVIKLEDTYSKLSGLSLQQDDLLRQALRCAQTQLFRAAHVMAWSGFVDFLEEKLASDGFKSLRQARPKWAVNTVEDLRESIAEYQLIEACRVVGLCSRTEMKALHGLLNKRNECAHPSNYFPGLNETLGYISEVLQRVGRLQTKTL